MKRLIIAVVMLFVSVTLAVTARLVTSDAIEDISADFTQCTHKEKNKQDDKKNIENLIETWRKKEKILFVFLPHDKFEEIEKNLIEMEYFLHFPDIEESTKLSYESAKMLKKINEEFSLSVATIF